MTKWHKISRFSCSSVLEDRALVPLQVSSSVGVCAKYQRFSSFLQPILLFEDEYCVGKRGQMVS